MCSIDWNKIERVILTCYFARRIVCHLALTNQSKFLWISKMALKKVRYLLLS